MNLALWPTMTVQQFLAWEEQQELRYEFDGIRAIPMNRGTLAHSAIGMNLIFALVGRLRGTGFQAHGCSLKIGVAGRIRYPDAFVLGSPHPGSTTVVQEPVVVFEVLSASTSQTDLSDKNDEYRATPSIQRYVILHQTHQAAMVFVRRGDDWVTELASGAGAVLAMPEIGIEVPLAEFYVGVAFPGAW